MCPLEEEISISVSLYYVFFLWRHLLWGIRESLQNLPYQVSQGRLQNAGMCELVKQAQNIHQMTIQLW